MVVLLHGFVMTAAVAVVAVYVLLVVVAFVGVVVICHFLLLPILLCVVSVFFLI